MFDSAFEFRYINHTQLTEANNGVDCIQHNFSFRGKSSKRYIVTIEQYQYSFYLVKFCLQCHKVYADKYSRLTGLNEGSRVFTTIGRIMIQMYRNDPFASFGFMGATLSSEKSKEFTKRFQLYIKIVSQLISPVLFEHSPYPKNSFYVLLNRDNKNENLLDDIISLMQKYYVTEIG